MIEKRSMNKKSNIFKVIAVGLLMVVLILGISVAYQQQKDTRIQGVNIELTHNTPHLLLNHQEIEQWLVRDRAMPLEQTSLKAIDIHALETKALSNPWIQNAEIFIDRKRMLNVQIIQRIPLARIFENTGRSYYVDKELHELPIIPGQNYPVPVYTNVPSTTSKILQEGLRQQIIKLSEFIVSDPFWSAQITQIEVNAQQEFVLIPLVGTHKIHFGDTTKMVDKFFNLQVFYKEVLDQVGWTRYNRLDLRFNGQVVAAPSLNKKAPKVDMAPFFEISIPKEESDIPMETILEEKMLN